LTGQAWYKENTMKHIVQFIQMVVRLIKSLFLPTAPVADQVTPRARAGTHPSQAWQSIVHALTTRYNGNLIAKTYHEDRKGSTRVYDLRALEATMEATEDGAIKIMDAKGHDVTELVVASVSGSMN
jgi:hypothetical protein